MSDDSVVNWDASPEDAEKVTNTQLTVYGEDDEVVTLIQIDEDGDEVSSQLNLSSPELTPEQATEITARIKTATNVLYLLVKRAHAGKAYKALGYNSFQDYIKNEFGFSKVYAYRLLNQANFIEEITSRVPEGTEVRVSEPVSTKLKHVLPELIAEIDERLTDGTTPTEAGAVIEDIIRERREQQIADEDTFMEDDDEQGTEEQDHGPYTGNGDYQGGYNGEDDDEDIEFIDDDDDNAGFQEDAAETRRKFDKIYNLYSGLKSLNAIGEGEELIEFLPSERHAEFMDLLETVVPWLSDFQSKFKDYLQNDNSEENASDEDNNDEESF